MEVPHTHYHILRASKTEKGLRGLDCKDREELQMHNPTYHPSKWVKDENFHFEDPLPAEYVGD
jgi:hypothetical protein